MQVYALFPILYAVIVTPQKDFLYIFFLFSDISLCERKSIRSPSLLLLPEEQMSQPLSSWSKHTSLFPEVYPDHCGTVRNTLLPILHVVINVGSLPLRNRMFSKPFP